MQSFNSQLGDRLRCQLAFNNPAALVSKLLKRHAYVDFVRSACSRNRLLDFSYATEFPEDSCSRLLILAPVSVIRAHWQDGISSAVNTVSSICKTRVFNQCPILIGCCERSPEEAARFRTVLPSTVWKVGHYLSHPFKIPHISSPWVISPHLIETQKYGPHSVLIKDRNSSRTRVMFLAIFSPVSPTSLCPPDLLPPSPLVPSVPWPVPCFPLSMLYEFGNRPRFSQSTRFRPVYRRRLSKVRVVLLSPQSFGGVPAPLVFPVTSG